MKKSFIICTANGWYWKAYNVEENAFSYLYTFFETVEDAEKHIENAISCRNGDPVLEVKQVYHKK